MRADNYVNTTAPEYARRMAASLDAKWAALKPHVFPGARVLDYGCGMPIQGGICGRVEAAGAIYERHDMSGRVEASMRARRRASRKLRASGSSSQAAAWLSSATGRASSSSRTQSRPGHSQSSRETPCVKSSPGSARSL